MLFFHASQVPDIRTLTPHLSEHGKALVYFSTKRENVLVYLSNAIEKYCNEVGFNSNTFKKWGSYGFTKDGILKLDEYYPNATIETYKGVSGFIYSTNKLEYYEKLAGIPHTVVSENSVSVDHFEFIADAYDALLEAAEQGKIILTRYENNSKEKLNWIQRSVIREYEQSESNPEYLLFLKAKFNFIL